MKPTEKQYGAYQELYDYLNESLFDNQLPCCMLTFTESRKKTAGYFSSNNWRGKGETVHEISLNAEYVREHSLKKQWPCWRIKWYICGNMRGGVHQEKGITIGNGR